jgi:predicted alpha/beta hydrolase
LPQFAANNGYSTLTLDYRGVAKSKPETLRGFRMRYLDWARYDLKAAVDFMTSDELPLFMVGHSFGGHAFGLLSNHNHVARFYTFGTGAGWHGWMPWGERLRVLFMWHVLGPLITRWKGYLAWKAWGFGEDLPLDVYKDWKRWCQYPHYFFDDPHLLDIQEHFERVTTPIVAANASDDLWAMPASRDAFMAAYRNADLQPVTIDASSEGIGTIGHMGYFRLKAQPLWEEALLWFAQHQVKQ